MNSLESAPFPEWRKAAFRNGEQRGGQMKSVTSRATVYSSLNPLARPAKGEQ